MGLTVSRTIPGMRLHASTLAHLRQLIMPTTNSMVQEPLIYEGDLAR